MIYMLDTNICIFAIRHKPPHVLEKIRQCSGDGLCISSITLSELEYGVAKSSRKEQNMLSLLQLMAVLKVLPYDDAAAEEYGRIRAELERTSKQIGPLDTLIAAHAKAEGLTLVTNNLGEFSRVPGLKVEDWTS